ncbi:hypothetical protein P7C71_g4606, partial [Lecanoromycetidae sp. Uapishka_2]
MKSPFSLFGTPESSKSLDITMAPPAACDENIPLPVPIHDYLNYKGANLKAIRNDFQHHPPDIIKREVIWKKTPLPENEGLYAVVLDNAFTAQECETLIKQAESSTNAGWEPAMVNVGGGRQRTITDTRDCGRIIWDDMDMIARIWDRVKDYVPEIHALKNMPRVTGNGPAKRKETWEMSRCNERMRFLKYGKGQYFKPHIDGCYSTPDGLERSYYTLHLYLSEGANGGATSFHSFNMQRQLDVEPKIGRVLIFQHNDLLHSGADVTGGLKYTMRTDLMYKKADE